MPSENGGLGIAGLRDAELIGSGGFADVYRARQDRFARTVAVKVLRTTDLDELAEQRFERECQALGALSTHPGIVTVYEGGISDAGRPYLVMEFFPRGSLADRIERDGPMPWSEVAEVGASLADALDAAHEAGILHRDIKPENVLVGAYGQVCLGDFGIARILGGTETKSGVVTASVLHAAPEVLGRARPTEAADIYGLGSTLFELLAGEPAFHPSEDEGLVGLLGRIANDPVRDLRPRGVPDELCRVVEQAMAKQAADRQASAALLAEDLRSLSYGRDTAAAAGLPPVPSAVAPDAERSRRKRRWPIAVAAVAGLVLLGGMAAAMAVTLDGRDSANAPATTAPTTETAEETTTSQATTTTTAPTTTTTAGFTDGLVGLTDTDPSHWIASDHEATQTFQLRVFDSATWETIFEFPVTMNGCDQRQLRVRWRSLSSSVRPAIGSYWPPDLEASSGPLRPDVVGDPATEGSMVMNGCEQPAFQLLPEPGTIANVAVEVAVYQPGVG